MVPFKKRPEPSIPQFHKQAPEQNPRLAKFLKKSHFLQPTEFGAHLDEIGASMLACVQSGYSYAGWKKVPTVPKILGQVNEFLTLHGKAPFTDTELEEYFNRMAANYRGQ